MDIFFKARDKCVDDAANGGKSGNFFIYLCKIFLKGIDDGGRIFIFQN